MFKTIKIHNVEELLSQPHSCNVLFVDDTGLIYSGYLDQEDSCLRFALASFDFASVRDKFEGSKIVFSNDFGSDFPMNVYVAEVVDDFEISEIKDMLRRLNEKVRRANAIKFYQ